MKIVTTLVVFGATALLAIAFPSIVLLLAIAWALTARARASKPRPEVRRLVLVRPEAKLPEPVRSRADALAARFG